MAFSFLSRTRESTAATSTRMDAGCIDHWTPMGEHGYLVLGWSTANAVPTAECRTAVGAPVPMQVDWILRMPRADVAPALAQGQAPEAQALPGFVLFLKPSIPGTAGLVLRFGSRELVAAAPAQAIGDEVRALLASAWTRADAATRARLWQSGLPPEFEALLPFAARESNKSSVSSSTQRPGLRGAIDSWAQVTIRPGILIEGWCDAARPRVLIGAGDVLREAGIGWTLRHPRADVMRALGLSPDEAPPGFVIFVPGVFPADSISRIVIVDDSGGSITRALVAADAGRPQQVLASAWRNHSRELLSHFAGTPPPEILCAVAQTADDPGGHASFHVDHLFEVPGERLLVDGWALDLPTAPMQLVIVDESSGAWVDLSTGWSRHERLDLLPESERRGSSGCSSLGFLSLVHLPGQAPAFGQSSTLAIYGVSETGEVSVQRVRLGRPATLKERIATVMSRIQGSSQQRLQSLARSAGPSLETWLQARGQDQAPARNDQFGALVRLPRVSILVVAEPDVDLIRVQLARLALDPYIREAAEVICAVDDRSLMEPAWDAAGNWHVGSGLPFGLLATAGDLGYAAAIRLAAREARGEFLLLLGADCLADQAGWLETLVQTLDTHADCGAVGPTLCAFDGAVSSAGQFIGPSDDHPPLMTVKDSARSPVADPSTAGTRVVGAVSGACLLTRAVLFRSLGGLESGFLERHHEAALYCLRLAALGHDTRLHAGPRLHHLAITRGPVLPDQRDAPSAPTVDPERIALYNAWRLDARLRALGQGR